MGNGKYEREEEMVKECTNKACRMFEILVSTPHWRCSACQRNLSVAVVTDANRDTPPLIEFVKGDSKVIPITHDDDTFTCEPDVEGCPIVERPRLEIPHDMFNEWIYLCRAFNTEWFGYLKGYQLAPNPNLDFKFGWRITEIYFPKQDVNSGHCLVHDGELKPETIGAVHSHVDMGAFFSKEDQDHMNHQIEAVLNRRGEIKAVCRIPLECGRFQRVDARIILVGSQAQVDAANALRAKLVEDQTQFGNTTAKILGPKELAKELKRLNKEEADWHHGM